MMPEPPPASVLEPDAVVRWLDSDLDWLHRAIALEGLPVLGYRSDGTPLLAAGMRSARGCAGRGPATTRPEIADGPAGGARRGCARGDPGGEVCGVVLDPAQQRGAARVLPRRPRKYRPGDDVTPR